MVLSNDDEAGTVTPFPLHPHANNKSNTTGEESSDDDDDADNEAWNSNKCITLLCILLCHALSTNCNHQHTYVAAIMNMKDQTEVQQEIMRIVQEQQQQQQQLHN